LIDLWGEIVKNKYNYTLAEIWGAGHHIAELALKAKGEDIEKGNAQGFDYEVENVLEVFNAEKFPKDYEFLTRLYNVLEEMEQ